MLSEDKKFEEEYSNIMNGLAESVFDMSDEEIEEEIDEEGDDTEDIRQVMLNAVKSCRQKKLGQARESYKRSLHSYQSASFEIPQNPDDKRKLIQSMIGSLIAQNQSSVTLQFRDYQDMPDEDLDGVLKQLFALNSKTETEE